MRWDELAVIKGNVMERVFTVAREGIRIARVVVKLAPNGPAREWGPLPLAFYVVLRVKREAAGEGFEPSLTDPELVSMPSPPFADVSSTTQGFSWQYSTIAVKSSGGEPLRSAS